MRGVSVAFFVMNPRYLLPVLLAAPGCASPSLQGLLEPAPEPEVVELTTIPDPEAETSDTPPPPPPSANSAVEFDTTTAEDRQEALAVETGSSGERSLGTTVATLGSPADPGIWLKTPLVSEETEGRVAFGGGSINIELRPSGGEPGSGSQISLPAMRLLNAPLTGIIELDVFAN